MINYFYFNIGTNSYRMNNHDNYIIDRVMNWIEIFQTYHNEGINFLFSI